ncbi:metal ABC transporter permease [Planomonospora sp. ID91781]|uniref:ABC transporter n=3 Tax=Planomonospora TaxID=1998 RepID=A0A171CI96_9ACTN|nr:MULTISPECIES: metal ABC transporter permease [Planomonospora]MBG0821678.1 metal ABC transporter permease [Planomonospora sp. ID91781]GAT66741.1 ABC transporter [Planomonospora sphaerica]GGK44527.1 ABC transporter [Planomonospora parontospora]GII06217.1 ABC transporter [Planomonospora parontospora subsp. parontospora]
MIDLLQYDFMQRAMIAALLIGLTAPAVGTFIVQRRLALLGDGIGHVALTGVALGFLTGTAPVLTAVLVSVLGAVAIELVRARGRTSGDVALALLFYGGIAGGVLLISLAPGGSNSTLMSYLFGSISTVTLQDVWVIGALAVAVLGVVAVFGRELFVLCQDEEVAKAAGLPVRLLSLLIAVTAALTVVIAMRVVGLLLVSALMVVPVATGQQLTRGFRSTMLLAMASGVVATVGGLTTSFYVEAPPGALIVLVALGGFVLALGLGRFVRRSRPQESRP